MKVLKYCFISFRNVYFTTILLQKTTHKPLFIILQHYKVVFSVLKQKIIYFLNLLINDSEENSLYLQVLSETCYVLLHHTTLSFAI